MKTTKTTKSRHIEAMANIIFDTLIGTYDLYTFSGCKKLAEDLYENGCVIIKRKDDDKIESEVG